ncbi:peptidoglycan/xylan/chitin deacetylase (PgdA/CDA1 family) [Alteromonadaceae bacterium 2753L.S.0a.02]|nr:peptidoglycan/xylan/chitin deacetylase (PgdA/CDA1 family) [Alteromonadaceae bacterium 2753L.S.0a.02]
MHKIVTWVLLVIGSLLLQCCTILDDHRWPVGHKKIILSFDDGPNPEISDALLDVLKKHNVKATFCFVGRNAEKYPQQVYRAVEEGHLLALHAFSRSYPAVWQYDTMLQEVELSKQAINEAEFPDGIKLEYYRPPRGLITPTVKKLRAETDIKIAYLSFYIHDAPLGPADIDGLFEKYTRKITALQGAAIVIHEARFKSDPEKDNKIDKSWVPAFVDKLVLWGKTQGYQFVQYSDAPLRDQVIN